MREFPPNRYGDSCLRAVGAAMKSAYGKSGLCYRISADEFCTILLKNINAVERLNADFCALLENMRRSDTNLPHISYGYAAYEPERMTVSGAVEAADQMMYEVKKRLT